jgi:hypothetical protein
VGKIPVLYPGFTDNLFIYPGVNMHADLVPLSLNLTRTTCARLNQQIIISEHDVLYIVFILKFLSNIFFKSLKKSVKIEYLTSKTFLVRIWSVQPTI